MEWSTQFEFEEAEYAMVPSRETGPTPRPAPQRVLIAALVACKCGNRWKARSRNGLDSRIGGYLVTCSVCRVSEIVNGRRFGL